ncbi:MAG: sigma-70 family RNA polymerase sigma factor [Bacteriovoracaceae bacterium]|nr:sigma-70 family RNA polymerase sigma factor [Bacteriovoracaceae bacterium]
MKGLSDEVLMEKYCAGEAAAFEVLYHRHKSRVWSYLRKRIKDEHAVHEIFQGIFMKLHRKRELYNSDYLFVKWLYTISRSELSDYFRKTETFTDLNFEQLHMVEYESVPTIDLEEMKGLTDNERKAVELKFYSDKDYDEISALLRISNSNARKLVSRGIIKLRKQLRGKQ